MKKNFTFLLIGLSIVLLNQMSVIAQNTEWKSYQLIDYNLPQTRINCIAFDLFCNKWLGTEHGLVKFDGEKQWTWYNPANSGLPRNEVISIAIENDNTIWLVANDFYGSTLCKFDGTNWTYYDQNNSVLNKQILSVSIDALGIKWIGSDGLVKFDNINWTVYNPSNSNLPANSVYDIAEDQENRKWIGTFGGLALFDESVTNVFTVDNSVIYNNWIRTLKIDSKNNIWLGHAYGGVSKYDYYKSEWTIYPAATFGNSWIFSMAIDAEDNVWVGTESKGLYKFDGSQWIVFNNVNSINSIMIDKQNTKWIGSTNFLVRYNEDLSSSFSLISPLGNAYVTVTPLFKWNASKNAKFYRLYIGSTLIQDNIYETSYQLTEEQTLSWGTRSWSVAAFNECIITYCDKPGGFTVDPDPPSAFNLLTPPDSSWSANSRPKFTYQGFSDVHSGELKAQFWMDNKILCDSIWPYQKYYTPVEDLSEGSHKWFVKAFNKARMERKSNQEWTINIDLTPPTAFSLITPANNETVEMLKPVFIWHSSSDILSGIDKYELNVSGYNPVIISPNDTVFEFPENLPEGSYSWYVKAFDLAGSYTSSEIFNLTVLAEQLYNIEGNVIYDNSDSSPLSSVKLKLKNQAGEIISETTSDNSGYFIFENLVKGLYNIEASYDKIVTNGIDPIDGLFINRYYLNMYKFTDKLKERAADVNADKIINPIDALIITRYYLQVLTSFKAGKWIFEAPEINLSSDNVNQKIKGICIGDVNGSHKP